MAAADRMLSDVNAVDCGPAALYRDPRMMEAYVARVRLQRIADSRG
jgi:hypothetical protein